MDAGVEGGVRLTGCGASRRDLSTRISAAKPLDTDSDANWTDRHGPVEEAEP